MIRNCSKTAFHTAADGGSTTVVVVAGGFHLPHCCYYCVIIHHRYAIVTAEGTPRRSESEERSQKSMVHGNRAGLCPVFWTRSFLVSTQTDLPTSAAANTAALHHPACCAFGVFFFSPHPPLPRASSGATSTEAPAS